MDQQQITELFKNNPVLVIAVALWTLIWKGTALWKAAGKKQLSWFVIILAINTVGLLEIAYIFYLYKIDLGSAQLLTKLRSTFKKS